MTEGRIWFHGNPWPEGHTIAEFAWTARKVGSAVWLDLHLRSADYDSERVIPDDESIEESWRAPAVWGNFHACTLSSTHWGGNRGFRAGRAVDWGPEWLDGRVFEVASVGDVVRDADRHAFHIYLLGHDAVANHSIAFKRRGDDVRFDIEWQGRIALRYSGRRRLEHAFTARITDVAMPMLPF